jgi:hypothetical protein
MQAKAAALARDAAIAEAAAKLAAAQQAAAKVAAAVAARAAAQLAQARVLQQLQQQGYFRNPVVDSVRVNMLPQLIAGVAAAVQRRAAAITVVDDLIAAAFAKASAVIAAAKADRERKYAIRVFVRVPAVKKPRSDDEDEDEDAADKHEPSERTVTVGPIPVERNHTVAQVRCVGGIRVRCLLLLGRPYCCHANWPLSLSTLAP